MSSQYSEISLSDFAEIYSQADSVFLIDVRETDEYIDGHVSGAIHIPLSEVPQRVEEFRHPQGGVTYVICKAGGRSANACEYLSQHSIQLINIAGGTMGWIMQGHAVVEGSQPSE